MENEEDDNLNDEELLKSMLKKAGVPDKEIEESFIQALKDIEDESSELQL